MAMTVLCPDAVERLEEVYDILRPGVWGDGVESISIIPALLPGVQCLDDSIQSGWPYWFALMVSSLYGATVAVQDERQSANAWARKLAKVLVQPVDYERAAAHFIIITLEPLKKHDGSGRLEQVQSMMRRRVAGEDVFSEECRLYDVANRHSLEWSSYSDIMVDWMVADLTDSYQAVRDFYPHRHDVPQGEGTRVE